MRRYIRTVSSYIISYTPDHDLLINNNLGPVPNIVLGRPVNKAVDLDRDPQLANQMTKYFSTAYNRRFSRHVRELIVPDSLVRYGRLRLAGDGDRIRTAGLIDNDRTGTARDNSYVKVGIRVFF
jgi:hypothetical protein